MSAASARRESRRGRIAKACSQCRTAKTRCTFKEGASACEKCLQRGFECTMHAQVPQTVISVDNGNGQIPNMPPTRPSGLASAPGIGGPSSSQAVGGQRQRQGSLKNDESGAPLSVETPPKGIGSMSPPSAGSTASHPASWMSGDSPQFYDPGSANSTFSTFGPDKFLPQLPISGLSVQDESMYMMDDASTPNGMSNSMSSALPNGNSSASSSSMPNGLSNNIPNGLPDGLPDGLADAGADQDLQLRQRMDSTPMNSAAGISPGFSPGLNGGGSIGGLSGIETPDLGEFSGLTGINGMLPDSMQEALVQTQDLGVPDAPQTSAMDSAEYFLNLGVFPEQLTTEMLQSRAQSTAADEFRDPMLDSLVNPVVRDPQQRFRFQNSASYAVLQAMDPALRGHLGAVSRLLDPPRRVSPRNIVNQRILQYSEVVKLFDTFKGNYDHWISLPDAEPQELVDYLLEQCPLLVTTCCCVALRFTPAEMWQQHYPALVRYLTYELAQTLVSVPQSIECLQALTILSKYADVLSYEDLVFDMWYVSGIGIQHLETVASMNGQFTYVHMRLWNHLVLAHLSSANITGRTVLVDDAGLRKCTLVLNESLSTRFDSCMVAELMIQWLTNQFLGRHISYEEFKDGVANWQREWGVLAQLPIIQFIEPVLLFCCFLAHWTHYTGRYGVRSPGTASLSQPPSPQSPELNTSLLPTETLERGFTDLKVILTGLLNIVQPNYFGCLSDSLHNIGFISSVMAIDIAHTLSVREPTAPEQRAQIKSVTDLIVQLAQRYKITSRGKDMSRTRYIALLHLLKPFYSS